MSWIITILGTVVGSIFFGVLGNLLTDQIKDWLSKRSLINKRKKIGELKNELEKTMSLFNNKESFYLEVTMDFIVSCLFLVAGIATGIFATTCLVLASISSTIFTEMQLFNPPLTNESLDFQALGILIGFIGYILMVVGFSLAIRLYNKIKRVKNFAQYRDEVGKRILELSSRKASK